MAVRVVKDGVEIWVENADELRMVVSALGDSQCRKAPTTQVIKPKSIADFYHDMNKTSKQHQLLKALREEPEGVSDYKLREKLGLKSGPALGGTLSGITKQAEKVGLKGSDIIESRIVIDEKSGWPLTIYKLTVKMLEAISGIAE